MMTKAEALIAMGAGKKVTHKLFSEEEWMSAEDGQITFEDGCRCDVNEFWSIRKEQEWNTGYSLWTA